MVGGKRCPTPKVSNCELRKSVSEHVSDKKLYRTIVGALQYAIITRPNNNFVVNKVSPYLASILDTHWEMLRGFS